MKSDRNDSIKEKIDQNAKEYLQNLQKSHKQELETLKKNPHQNITSTHSFVGYTQTFFNLGSLKILAEQLKENPSAEGIKEGDNLPSLSKKNST